MTLRIGDRLVVEFHYTLTDDAGELIDSSVGGDPLTYLYGASNIIPGLEKAMTGKIAGASFKVDVLPEEAYGKFHAELKQRAPEGMFKELGDIQVGMQFEAQGPNGQVQMLTVTEIVGKEITVDANHPLAGRKLSFAVNIETVREATPEEVEHGHAH